MHCILRANTLQAVLIKTILAAEMKQKSNSKIKLHATK